MSAVCELSGKKVMYGNNVSHSQRRTRRAYAPNLQLKSFYSEIAKVNVRFRVSSRVNRSICALGGFDEFMIKSDVKKMSLKARRTQKTIFDAIKRSNINVDSLVGTETNVNDFKE